MSEDVLALPHDKFSLRIIKGTVKESNGWSESRVEGGGGSMRVTAGFGHGHQNKVQTTTTNYTEFWVESEDEIEHYYRIGSSLPIREGQSVEVIELVYSKNGKVEPIIVINHKQNRYYTLMKPRDLMLAERAWSISFLLLFLIFGFAGWTSPVFGPLHLVSLLVGIPWLIKKRRYYKKKLKSLEAYAAS